MRVLKERRVRSRKKGRRRNHTGGPTKHQFASIMTEAVRREHPVKGDHVAMVPSRDALIVTGSDDQAGLTRIASLAMKALLASLPAEGQLHPLSWSGVAVRLEGETWVPFLPSSAHPHHQ